MENKTGSFNDKYKIKNPLVRLQEERFSEERMRKSLKTTPEEPENLDKYTIGAADTGIYTEWNSDDKVLRDMCNWLIHCASFYLREENDKTRRKKCLDVMDDFVPRYEKAMDGKYNYKFPWGKTWYEFSVTSTLMLFYYMLIAAEKGRKIAIELILSIIKTPKSSLGSCRDQANSVYMALPWIVAHYYKGDVETASQCADYNYVIEYLKLQPVKTKKEQGLYLDNTYITHKNCLAYGYLKQIIELSSPLFFFDNNIPQNFFETWDKCWKILAHPKISYGSVGFYSREKTLKSFSFEKSKLGIEVIPTCLFIRMYGDDYSFAVRGQNSWIAYYESDLTDNDMAQYWVQYRNIHFAEQEYEPKFPDVGFFYERYAEEHPDKPVKERCKIPSHIGTTETFCTEPNKKSLLNAGFVFSYGNIGIMRHFYNCAQMRYTQNKSSEHGRFSVDEYILCDYNNHTIDIWICIYRHMNYDMIFFVEKEHLWAENENNVFIYHLKWDCKNRKLTWDRQAVESPTDKWDLYYPEGIEVVFTDNGTDMDTFILLDHGKPKLAMHPYLCKDLNRNFKTTYQNKEFEFVFDEQINQYRLADALIIKDKE